MRNIQEVNLLTRAVCRLLRGALDETNFASLHSGIERSTKFLQSPKQCLISCDSNLSETERDVVGNDEQYQQARSFPSFPIVEVKKSQIHPDAGLGVFVRSYRNTYREDKHAGTMPQSGNDNFLERIIPAGTLMCLYPGEYTPPLPSHSLVSDDASVDDVYLANKDTDYYENNAYVLNLPPTSIVRKDDVICHIPLGFVDAAKLHCPFTARKLNRNPSACGHLVNHHSLKANVKVVSFLWEVFLPEGGANNSSHGHNANNDQVQELGEKMEIYDIIPNALRMDGSPWYFDERESRIVNFPRLNKNFCKCHKNPDEVDPRYSSSQEATAGAALCSIRSIALGEELLLNYRLNGPPYPSWAESWYKA